MGSYPRCRTGTTKRSPSPHETVPNALGVRRGGARAASRRLAVALGLEGARRRGRATSAGFYHQLHVSDARSRGLRMSNAAPRSPSSAALGGFRMAASGVAAAPARPGASPSDRRALRGRDDLSAARARPRGEGRKGEPGAPAPSAMGQARASRETFFPALRVDEVVSPDRRRVDEAECRRARIRSLSLSLEVSWTDVRPDTDLRGIAGASHGRRPTAPHRMDATPSWRRRPGVVRGRQARREARRISAPAGRGGGRARRRINAVPNSVR